MAIRSWQPEPSHQGLATRARLPGTGYQTLATCSWITNLGYQIFVNVNSRIPRRRCRVSVWRWRVHELALGNLRTQCHCGTAWGKWRIALPPRARTCWLGAKTLPPRIKKLLRRLLDQVFTWVAYLRVWMLCCHHIISAKTKACRRTVPSAFKKKKRKREREKERKRERGKERKREGKEKAFLKSKWRS